MRPLAVVLAAALLVAGGVRAQAPDRFAGGGLGLVQPVGSFGEVERLGWQVFGAATDTLPVSSTKSMTGHLLSAAAALEALAGLAALVEQAVPPTINLDEPDPECDLCHVRNEAVAHRVNVVLSNSFGFGGSNTSLVLRRAA